jgi:hypothetical protein
MHGRGAREQLSLPLEPSTMGAVLLLLVLDDGVLIEIPMFSVGASRQDAVPLTTVVMDVPSMTLAIAGLFEAVTKRTLLVQGVSKFLSHHIIDIQQVQNFACLRVCVPKTKRKAPMFRQ